MSGETSPGDIEANRKPEPDAGERRELSFVLRYDEEIAFLLNEGVIRPGMLPSGFKEN